MLPYNYMEVAAQDGFLSDQRGHNDDLYLIVSRDINHPSVVTMIDLFRNTPRANKQPSLGLDTLWFWTAVHMICYSMARI